MKTSGYDVSLDENRTRREADQLDEILKNHTSYEAAKMIAGRFLGARKTGDGQALFGFWVPGLVTGDLVGKAHQIKLEILTPLESIDFRALKKGAPVTTSFQVDEVQPTAVGDYMIAVVNGVQIGRKEQAGSFYWLRYAAGDERYIIRDPLVASTPFGVYAPAELFDIEGMLANRRDFEYFKSWNKIVYPDGSYRAKDIGSHLEIHPETATEAGTIEALTIRYQTIGQKIQSNIDAQKENMYDGLTPADLNFIGFDSIELTPEVPQAEREGVEEETGEFFQFLGEEDQAVIIQLKRPDISNWGYDTPVLGSAAVNPSILGSLRPNELLEFIETIHLMPGRPIQLCIDSVLGHCDFQGARLLETFDQPSEDRTDPQTINSKYLTGSNMYGRDIDFSEPNVKAILLELLVRKINYGFDCVRVDGAQDFIRARDEHTGFRLHDDKFLNEMANVVQDINGLRRRPDMNLEDGRPWPDDLNWLYNSKYLDHTIERTLPFDDRVKQWSPIIFAHNVHGKYKWFMNKWDRFVEVFRYGENWITGHSNHDNVRYFYRLVDMKPSSLYRPGDPFDDYYNDQLGATMKEAAHNAMDHNGLTALTLGFLPGNPMFLLNALFHTPWLFMRDIDKTYAVRIVGDEGSRFLSWYVDEALYNQSDKFRRLKKLGFLEYRRLVAPPAEKQHVPGFMDALFALCQQIKTEALMVRFLFDDPADAGGFAHVDELRAHHQTLVYSEDERDEAYRAALEDRLHATQRDTPRKIEDARKLMAKNRRFLQRDRENAPADKVEEIAAQLQKLAYLAHISDRDLGFLLHDADLRTEYNVETWAADPQLNALAPTIMQPDGYLTAEMLNRFSLAFMLDARDAAKVHQYEAQVDPFQARFNFTLRQFRQQNPWLLKNPTNDVRLDYFGRKLFINGAKDIGDWGDKGDVINSNTIYYGWRTNPEKTRQVFLIANMEGKPLDRCPLNLFMNQKGSWRVVAASPTMNDIPERIDQHFVIEDFRNGQALLIERSLIN